MLIKYRCFCRDLIDQDENGNVFYMVLRASKEERTDEIELQVFGVESPGKSIFQLCRLLHKKVMTLGVENLSAVLAKNPYFSLLPGDIAFLRSYKSNSDRALEEVMGGKESNETCEYYFPVHVNDPLMMLFCFFQNICGSTFFHRLHEAVDVSSRSGNNEVHVPGSTLSSPFKGCDDGLVRYSSKFFSLFYNNTSTHLNPQFQSVRISDLQFLPLFRLPWLVSHYVTTLRQIGVDFDFQRSVIFVSDRSRISIGKLFSA